MPQDIQPPKTIEEVGIHLVYMSKAMNATNESLQELKNTLKDMQNIAVSRIDFEEHVLWGKTLADDHESRIAKLEEHSRIENASLMHRVLKGVDSKIVGLIIAVMFGTFIYGTYMLAKYSYLINLPEVKAITSKE